MKKIILQIIIVVFVFNLVSMIRESDMLSSWKNEPAPEYTLSDLNDNPVNLVSGQKKTVLYFFAPWCSVCKVSIGNLQNIHESNKNVKIVAIALDYHDKNAVLEFAKDLDLDFSIVLGNEDVKQAYKVSAYPSYYVLNQQQEIQFRSMGYSTELGLRLRSL